MQYTMRTLSCDQAVETLEAHVLARAYRAAWRARYGNEPSGPHVIAGLDLVIEFGRSDPDREALSVPPRTTLSNQPENLDSMAPGFIPGAAGIGAIRGIAGAKRPAPRAPRDSQARPTKNPSTR